jgi:hypothetical protein
VIAEFAILMQSVVEALVLRNAILDDYEKEIVRNRMLMIGRIFSARK